MQIRILLSPMKILPVFLGACLFVGSACAQEREVKTSPLPETNQQASQKSCRLCQVPGRAALLAGRVTIEKCLADCTDLCCTGTELVLVLAGFTKEDESAQLAASLSGLKAVLIRELLSESGRTILKYDAEQTSALQLRTTLKGAGFRIISELCTFKIDGLRKPGASNALREVLASTVGVSAIDTICEATGQAIIEYDPARTNPQRLATAINATPFRVIP
ncbi:MAG: hypothetical protein CMO40_02400 [Verrucomicrobiaceae bacterium]|nr:hypothetical protein [Verrucomicrobiaceae bacterium]